MKPVIKKTLLTAFAAAFGLASFGAGEGASQKWVKQYVEQYVSNAIAKSATTLAAEAKTTSSNSVNTIEIGEGEDRVTFTWEDATVYALMVTNATASVAEYGITNGFVFVWDGDNSFVNGNGELVKITSDTNKTCYTWHEVDSVRTNNLDVFDGKFSVGGVMIQPSVALGITNALTTASTKRGVLDVLFSFLFPSAYAAAQNVPSYWTGEAVKNEGYGWISQTDGKGGKVTVPIKLTPENILKYYDEIKSAGSTAHAAMLTALEALIALWNTNMLLSNVASTLSNQDWSSKETQVNDTAEGVSYSGNITKSGARGYVLNVPNSIVPKTDGKTITTKRNGNDKYLCLANLPASTSVVRIPTLTSRGSLTWNALTGLVDGNSLCPKGTYNDTLEIKGWSSQGSCQASMASMIFDETDPNISKHEVLCRFKDGGDTVLHYVPFGSPKVGLKFVGSDGSTNWGSDDGTPIQTISFASADDSNVQIKIGGSKKNPTITIGVYYK